MPRFQQTTWSASQTKTVGTTKAELIIDAIGASYKVNAKTKNANGNEGTERKDLTARSAAYQLAWASGTANGSSPVRLGLTANVWALVDVSASVKWRSN